jgi:hypothetical protein
MKPSFFKGRRPLLPLLLHQHDGQRIIGATSTVIMKRLISDCTTTTLKTIACTPIILLPEVSYVEDSFPKHYA